MSDDIVTRLRAYNIGNIGHEASFHMEETLYEAADEIERLRRALDLAVGELSTNDKYRLWNPEQLRQQLLDEAVRGE